MSLLTPTFLKLWNIVIKIIVMKFAVDKFGLSDDQRQVYMLMVVPITNTNTITKT